MPNPVGRPKKTIADLPKGWQKKMLEAANEGKSELSIRVSVLGNIAHDTWERLIAEEPEFSETVKHCRGLIQNWWEELGRQGATTEVPVNPTMWIFNMKNRFDWCDKTDIGVTNRTELLRTVRRLDGSEPELIEHAD